MPYHFLDHTGDVGFELEAGSLPELLREAVAAFAGTLAEPERLGGGEVRELEVAAPAPDLLLHALLEELLYLFEREGFLAREGEMEVRGEEGPLRLRARLHGERWDPERTALKLLVKGVTYHRLAVESRAGRLHGRVVLDI
ncbi:MAG: archease [Thermoanaerobaculia bacterium]|nr:archease [Thermoanaerobaculia bacterium]MCZ7651109.1 archease [Thermoanaerobaculia bacterium]